MPVLGFSTQHLYSVKVRQKRNVNEFISPKVYILISFRPVC